ncbi:MAG: Gfo/Idh/MocA family oxidoreductase [Opitutaceae bacterium]
MKKLRVAVIGAGWVSLHRHVPAIRSHPDAELVGIMDRKPGRASQAAKDHRILRFAEVSRASDAPWFNEVDAVAIATAPFTHAALAMECLRAGKHVITEKPFAMNTEEGQAMLTCAKESGKTLAVVHNFQFSTAFARAHADLKTGQLGELMAVEATQFSNPNRRLPEWFQQLPGGLFYDESPHLLYLMKVLGGGSFELTTAYANRDSAGSQTPAQLTAFLVGGNKCPLRLSVSFVAPLSEWQIFICGSKRLAVIDIFRDVYISLPNDGEHVTSTVLRTSALATLQHWFGSIRPGLSHVLGKALYGNDELYSRFVRSCLSGKPPQDISAEDGYSVLEMQHRILQACNWT